MQTVSFTEFFNPLKYFSVSTYTSFWQMLFNTLLYGFWAKFFAVSSLVLAFWFGVYRQRFGMGISFFILSLFFSYFGGILKLF